MNIAVIVFPGSSSQDAIESLERVTGKAVRSVWYTETSLEPVDLIVIPGGFSYGNYFRQGALAKHAPIMNAVISAAEQGVYVLGVNSGFSLLTEVGLLPGALLQNESLKFHCEWLSFKVVNQATPFTKQFTENEEVKLPIAHASGHYYCDDATLEQLKANKQIVLEYSEQHATGSLERIAAIQNKEGNVLGMMPFPDRAVDSLLGSADGSRLFSSIMNAWRETHDTTTNR